MVWQVTSAWHAFLRIVLSVKELQSLEWKIIKNTLFVVVLARIFNIYRQLLKTLALDD